MKNSADQGGCTCHPPWLSSSVDNTRQDLQNSLYPTKAEFNNIVLLFTQNNSKFKNKLKCAYLGRF